MSYSRLLGIALSTAVLLTPVIVSTPSTSVHASVAGTAGCGRAWTPGTDVAGTLPYGGLQRTYVLHIPKTYGPTAAVPLILNLHGGGMQVAQEESLTHLSKTADAQGFLVVYPQGTTGTGTSTGWNAYPPGSPGSVGSQFSGVDDVGFLTALVSSLEGQLCIDSTRIAASGMSDGGIMSYHLACSNLPWLAAIAPVAATMPQSQSSCRMAHPTPLLAFNGEQDAFARYTGYGVAGSAIPQVVAAWAAAVGCPSTGRTGFTQGDVVETVYTPCSTGADTALYTITDGGHTWPGGYPVPALGYTTTVIDASALIGSFVAAHPLH